MITEKVKPVLVFFKNKYIIVSIAFAVWMLFIDTKDIGFMLSNSRKLRDLKKSEVALQKDIKDTKKELSFLKTDASSIEKYAREKFYMKKDNEDLFVTDTK
jgi:cell division protein DivIC